MGKRILITGGAGFIGSHLADELLAAGYHVRVLDNLSPQVHGPDCRRPAFLAPETELMVGDVRDRRAVENALQGIDSVYHLAARVGVGQSMYQIRDYVDDNDLGTATLLQVLIDHPVERLVVASSMSIYGEGLYLDRRGHPVEDLERDLSQLQQGSWEVLDHAGRSLTPVPTPENKRAALSSIYALSKFVQERQCLLIGQAYGIPVVALRFFNVYGTRQALSNPYTGVLAIFASRLLNDHRPMIFEDGLQRRDFVHVSDVAQACRLAVEVPNLTGQVLNIGSGTSYPIRHIALRLAEILGKGELTPDITSRFRVGDIRHCFADILLAREVLGYRPQVNLEEGLVELAEWLADQVAYDRVEQASHELASRGLTL
ncbi:MAG: NAD-dependent epimerase/dehydratase family protein [Desulfuromonadales bacterium]|nr:NAD-dependent epimerase/dehydratase family protein [Desulfuromonadales bacterium]